MCRRSLVVGLGGRLLLLARGALLALHLGVELAHDLRRHEARADPTPAGRDDAGRGAAAQGAYAEGGATAPEQGYDSVVFMGSNGAPAAANCAEHRARMVQGLVEIAIDPLFPPARGDGDGASRSRAATEKPGAAGGWEFVCSVGPP